jgi:hypothetical protein
VGLGEVDKGRGEVERGERGSGAEEVVLESRFVRATLREKEGVFFN